MRDPTRFLLVLLALLSVLAGDSVSARRSMAVQPTTICQELRAGICRRLPEQNPTASVPTDALAITLDTPRLPGSAVIRHRSRGPPSA